MEGSYWNYRLIKDFTSGLYFIAEVYYENGRPHSWCDAVAEGPKPTDVERDLCDQIASIRFPALYWDGKKLKETEDE